MTMWEFANANPGIFLLSLFFLLLFIFYFLCKIVQCYSQAQANRCNVEIAKANARIKNGEDT